MGNRFRELDHKEGWVPKNWCFWTVVLEKTLESLLDYKAIKLVSPKGNQSWIFTGGIEAEAPILWPPDGNSWHIGKDLMLGKIEGKRRRECRGRNGSIVSLTRWTWVWVHSGSWWWTGRPGVLRFMGLQRVGHDWETELNWTEICATGCAVKKRRRRRKRHLSNLRIREGFLK